MSIVVMVLYFGFIFFLHFGITNIKSDVLIVNMNIEYRLRGIVVMKVQHFTFYM